MTPVESRQITDLSVRLFGEDGQGGSLGRIETMLNTQDGRIAALERDRIAREAVSAAGDRLDKERQARFRWQITTAIALAGTGIALLLGIVNTILVPLAERGGA